MSISTGEPSVLLTELLKLAERNDLTPKEVATLNLAIANLGAEHKPMLAAEKRFYIPWKIELPDGQLYLHYDS